MQISNCKSQMAAVAGGQWSVVSGQGTVVSGKKPPRTSPVHPLTPSPVQKSAVRGQASGITSQHMPTPHSTPAHLPFSLPSARPGETIAGFTQPPRPSPLAPRPFHSGISLMEVLVSIGIVAIGLVSVLSLLPVGGIQAQRAETEERKAALGLNAVQDLKNRGVLNMANWRGFDTSTNTWVQYTFNPASTSGDFLPPIMIDPFMAAVAKNNTEYTTISNCPPVPLFTATASPTVHGLGMKRLTLQQACTVVSGNLVPNGPLTQALCVSHDDTFANRPDDASLPAESPYSVDAANNPLKRDFEGLFSWLITLTPTELEYEHIAPQPKRQYLMSLVIFNRRLPIVPNGDGTQEEIVKVFENPPTQVIDGIGGGDMALYDETATAETKLELADPGNWLMLCRYQPTGGSPTVWPVFQWYRIVNASPVEATDSSKPLLRQRDVTLSGPDWQKQTTFPVIAPANWPAIPGAYKNYNTYACLFDNIVAVYQRPIWLEGSSMWSQ
jgi:type II secretory pathway pseudopilin PulG